MRIIDRYYVGRIAYRKGFQGGFIVGLLVGAVVAIVLLAMHGCASAPPQILYQAKEVDIPIAAECKAPPPFEMPDLAIARIDEKSSDADTARAYEETVESLEGAVMECSDDLDGYRSPPADSKKAEPSK